MVTKEDVANAFRFFLGREPESEAVVDGFVERAASLADLRRAFMASDEFRLILGGALPSVRYSYAATPLAIETVATDAELAQMVRSTEETWARLGATEPHWSVLTHDNFTAARIEENSHHFFNSGRPDAQGLLDTCARNNIAVPHEGTCFELGCGVGRISIWLADLFRHVIAADISDQHLAIARATALRHGKTNINFLHLRAISQIPEMARFDAFFSVIVLQHNPPPVMRALLSGILGRLNPGGVAYFQLPVMLAGYRFESATYKPAAVGIMEMHAFPQAPLFSLIAEQGCEIIECRDDQRSTPGMVSNMLLLQKR